MDDRINKDSSKKLRRYGQTWMVPYYWWMFKLLVMLFMNVCACWLCKTNSVNRSNLIQNKCRVWNGRTQDSLIQRMIKIRRWRLRYKIHVTRNGTHNQICTTLEGAMLRGYESSTNVCSCFLVSRYSGGVV